MFGNQLMRLLGVPKVLNLQSKNELKVLVQIRGYPILLGSELPGVTQASEA